MTTEILGGRFAFPGSDLTVNRVGYGAMQLAGPHVFGPPRDHDAAVAVLRAAVAAGVDHIDTSDFYGPHVTNRIIREALHPYPDDLVIVTKLGARRDGEGNWLPACSASDLERGLHDNLANLGRETIDIVNMRYMGAEADIETPLATLLDLQRQGLIGHIGVSTVTPDQLARARAVAPIVCVQNEYNLAHREDDALIDALAADGIAYVPYFPLGGFSPLQSATLDEVAASLGATAMQVALAWLLQRSPNILLIPGTSSPAHLRDNLAAATLVLPADALAKLEGIAEVTISSTPLRRP